MYKIILLFVSLITSNIAFSDCNFSDYESGSNSYIGMNVQIRHMTYYKNYGHNFLRRNLPQISVHGGIQIIDPLWIEIGYEKSIKRNRFSISRESDVIAGTPVPAILDYSLFRGLIKMEGPYVDIIRNYSILKSEGLQFFMSAGISFLKGKAERQIICTNEIEHICSARVLKEDKFIPRLSMGIKYMISPHLGGKWTIGWQNTSKMKFYPTDDRCGIYYPEIKPKDSITFGLGVFWAF